MERHALTFPVRPGTEDRVRRVLGSYPRPETEIGGGARLLGTSVFLWANRVLRVLDVTGPLPVVMRHLSEQPAIRRTEQELNPLLVEPRDLTDPQAARAFFTRAMMRRVVHRVTDPELLTDGGGRTRIALRYPVREGRGGDLAEVLSAARSLSVGSPRQTVLASTTVFQHTDFVVRVAEFACGLDEAAAHLGRTVVGAPGSAAVDELLQPGWQIGTEAGFARFFAEQRLSLVTDRRAEGVPR
ncbi:SchA/CurD-like domain-containing protein [Actinokineospora sp. NBRC 105648]|uniref:SchA/CurD-like domain-containing protein n=1 Tax=Actinokineospora sp. NBRC 105648 TaxID=3032206 RepID=UPI0024A231BC|nr:SchA/CurD-like domain-containing protein [Actinokineospora sp. NBRC 105648]GLZ42037.1 hypothetical protein Acsp05_56610 [Actinokineospora sp. NBRC 105648]